MRWISAADQLITRYHPVGEFIQAWGYGLALACKYTGRKEYIDLFRKVTEYFLTHLPKDLIPYWDLEFTDGDADQNE